MKKHLIITNLLAILLMANITNFAQNNAKDNKFETVKAVESVDLTKYSGKWFEIARYPNRFQKKCAGEVTATYTIKKKNILEILNECVKKNGKKISAKGKAKVVDTESNAKLKLDLPQVFYHLYHKFGANTGF